MTDIPAENLFRRQAIQSLRYKQPGRPICLMPRPWMWLNSLLVLMFVVAAIFLGNVEYARKEVARGWLVAQPGVIRITHHTAASVREVAHQPGDQVAAGDVLVYLSNDSVLPGGQSKDEQSLRQLRQDLVEIDSQIRLSQQRFRIDNESLGSQLRDLDNEITSIEAQVRAQQQKLNVGGEQLARIEDAAANDAVSVWALMQQQRDHNALQQDLSVMQQKLLSLRRNRKAFSGQKVALPIQAEAEQSALRVQRSGLALQVVELETRRLSVITSPISGTVTSVEAHAGNSVSAGQLLMTVLPEKFELGAELYVPSRAAGQLRAGQTVRLNYDAFPYQEFGAFPGRIERISEFVSLPADLPQPFPMQEVSYKVRVRIARTRIETDLGSAELRPGMLLVAEIVLENRKLIDWLIEPLGLRGGLRI